jgi:hypothetical protein
VTEQPNDPAQQVPPPGPWHNSEAAKPPWTGGREPSGPAWTPNSDSAIPATASDAPYTSPYSSPTSRSPTAADVIAAGLERPEVVIGAAFVGGLLLATILKRLAR